MSKFKITIRRVETEEYEMILEGNSLMVALDEARRLVANRNKKSKIGQFAVAKIETQKE